ncbi:uncharacterized protein YALI1_D09297g [Yarrowia lipolytica]|uniref:Uncharacterized protein n=1 Tax=Yarrowia lipolytica TaxID=4952 RepID=A0A1D8NDK3_YARLL|nr:hypothetical protein YALI1_D09297g [Yarrowia lipolytica]
MEIQNGRWQMDEIDHCASVPWIYDLHDMSCTRLKACSWAGDYVDGGTNKSDTSWLLQVDRSNNTSAGVIKRHQVAQPIPVPDECLSQSLRHW